MEIEEGSKPIGAVWLRVGRGGIGELVVPALPLVVFRTLSRSRNKSSEPVLLSPEPFELGRFSVDLRPAAAVCATLANRSLRVGFLSFSSSFLSSFLSFSGGVGGVNFSSVGEIVKEFSLKMGIGKEGVPKELMSMRGLDSFRGREPEVALDADEPGRLGIMRVARGASSESESEDEVEEEDADALRRLPSK